MLTLFEALKTNRLQQFINEQEAYAINPIVEKEFQQLSEKLIESEQSKDQTSRSVSHEGPTGKQIR